MTITDIARISGVGVSTVSRVLNEHPDVKPATREKVLQVIKKYNYIPNNSARILKRIYTKNIGVLVKGVFNPFFSVLLKDINTSIEGTDYTMILHYHDNTNDLETLLGFIKEKRLQGVICLGGNFEDITKDSFSDLEVAVVMLSVDFNVPLDWKNFSTISIGNEISGYQATEYLIQKGHRNIAIMLGDQKDISVGKLRYLGYQKAHVKNGLQVKKDNILYGYYETSKAYEEAKSFIKQYSEVTAIFVTSDIMAIGVAKAVTDLGFKVGKDISIMGFDGMDVATYYEPTITTVKQPKNLLVEKSVGLLFGLLNKECGNQHIVLKTKLLEGNSVGEI